MAGKNLRQKLVTVMGGIGDVPKNGFNSFQNYYYRTEEDINNAIKKRLVDEGIIITQSITGQRVVEKVLKDKDGRDKIEYLTLADFFYTIYDTESDEVISVNHAGQGSDPTDKGLPKACTSSLKYFLSKMFLISTDDDVENDRNETSVKPQKTYSKPTESKPVENKPTQSNANTNGKEAPEGSPTIKQINMIYGRCQDKNIDVTKPDWVTGEDNGVEYLIVKGKEIKNKKDASDVIETIISGV